MPRPWEVKDELDLVTADFVYVRWLRDRKAIEGLTTTWNKPLQDLDQSYESGDSRWPLREDVALVIGPGATERLDRKTTSGGLSNFRCSLALLSWLLGKRGNSEE
jgi:hypothetical protein